jgi:hypothetical protein
MPRKKKSTRARLKRVTVRAEPHPEPDWDRFAWAVLQHARSLGAPDAKPEPEPDAGESS